MALISSKEVPLRHQSKRYTGVALERNWCNGYAGVVLHVSPQECPMATVDLPRPDVPRPIAVVRDFVNTTDHETGTDDLTTPAALSRYLVAEGLMERETRATRADLGLALRLRAGLRTALELNHDGASDSLPTL